LILFFKFLNFILLPWFLTLGVTCRFSFCLFCSFKSLQLLFLNASLQNIWGLVNLKFLLIIFTLGGKHQWSNGSTNIFTYWPVIFGLENFFITFKHPFCVPIHIFLINYSKYVDQLILEWRCLFIIIVSYCFLIVFRNFNFINEAVVNGLICFLVWKTEPGSFESLFRWFFLFLKCLHSQQNNCFLLSYLIKMYLNFSVIINFQWRISEIILKL